MNRYPLWKNLSILLVLVVGLLYTLPNFFGEVPAVQVSSSKSTVKVDSAVEDLRTGGALNAAKITYTGTVHDDSGLRIRFTDDKTQLQAKDLIEKTLNPVPDDTSYVVALNLLSASPNWLSSLGAHPMYLGLDLRGGVHFLLQVDMKGALTKQLDATSSDLRTSLREKKIYNSGVTRDDLTLTMRFSDAAMRDQARNVVRDGHPELTLNDRTEGSDLLLVATLAPVEQTRIQEEAVKQNIITLHNRVNELGVAEPVIQQQGPDRIVVQLPGVQDVGKAKDLIGRTATLEVRMVQDSDDLATTAPANSDSFPEIRNGAAVPHLCEEAGRADGRPFRRRHGELRQQSQPGRIDSSRFGRRPHHAPGNAREHQEAHGHHPVREEQGRSDF